MSEVYMLAIDLAKRSFQVCAVDRSGAVIFNRSMSRPKLIELLGRNSTRPIGTAN